jgi:hypothetical protein
MEEGIERRLTNEIQWLVQKRIPSEFFQSKEEFLIPKDEPEHFGASNAEREWMSIFDAW